MSPSPAFKRCLAALFLFACAGSALAQTTYTWTGGGGNVNFSTAGNWDTLPPDPVATTVNLTFAGSTNTGTLGSPLLQNVTNLYRLSQLIFSADAGAFVIGGSTTSRTFNMRTSPTIQNQSTTSKQTLLLNLGLVNTVAVTGASTNAPVEIAGNLTGNAGASVRLASADTYLILSGDNSGYVGTGRIQIAGGGILGINNNNAIMYNLANLATQYLEITSAADGARLRAETTDRTVVNGINAAADFTLEGQHNLTFSGSAALNTSLGALAVTVDTGRTLTFAGDTAQTGTAAAIFKLGNGNLAVGDARADAMTGFSSGLTVSAGTLLINATGTNIGAIGVDSGATLGGTGSVSFANNTSLSVSGTLTAGDSGQGTMSLTLAGSGKLNFADGSFYQVELGGANDGILAFDTTGDWLAVASGAKLDIIDGGSLQNNVWYTLFSGLTAAPITDFGFTGATQGNFRLDNGNYQVQLVPEPATVVLFLVGGLVILAFRKRTALARSVR